MDDIFLQNCERIVTTVDWQAVFQRVPGTWMILAVILAILGPVYSPTTYSTYFVLLHFLLIANNFRYAYGIYSFYKNSIIHATTNWQLKYCQATGTSSTSDLKHDLPFDHLVHLIVIPNYKEDVNLIKDALDILASHSMALTQYKICLAMECSEEDSQEKAILLQNLYRDLFFDVTFTMHPRNIPMEIRGKGSNVAWAVKKMAETSGGGVSGRHGHEVVTVMDVDNTLAQDYFTALAFYYTTAKPEERKLMMFTPGTIFDRNSNNIPVFVRVVDFGWSIGSMSNLYQDSAAKLPLSTYSISLDLAISVNFWDTGPEAIGEDCHMYLKCFFSTQGRVIVKTIFSPASVCNVETSDTKGIVGYTKGLNARYVQGKRHLWASLDTGYMLRRSLLSTLVPNYDLHVHNGLDTKPSTKLPTIPARKLLHLMHRVLEAHTFMCQIFLFILLSVIIIPQTSAAVEGSYIWTRVFKAGPIHPHLELGLWIGFIARHVILLPNIATIYYYLKYHRFVGFERWVLAARNSANSTNEEKVVYNNRNNEKLPDDFPHQNVGKDHLHLKVHRLGKRPELCSSLKAWKFTSEFAAFSIISAACFYLGPQIHAQLSHLFTNKLDYTVAGKPTSTTNITLSSTSSAAASASSSTMVENHQEKSQVDGGEFLFEGDSGVDLEHKQVLLSTSSSSSPDRHNIGNGGGGDEEGGFMVVLNDTTNGKHVLNSSPIMYTTTTTAADAAVLPVIMSSDEDDDISIQDGDDEGVGCDEVSTIPIPLKLTIEEVLNRVVRSSIGSTSTSSSSGKTDEGFFEDESGGSSCATSPVLK